MYLFFLWVVAKAIEYCIRGNKSTKKTEALTPNATPTNTQLLSNHPTTNVAASIPNGVLSLRPTAEQTEDVKQLFTSLIGQALNGVQQPSIQQPPAPLPTTHTTTQELTIAEKMRRERLEKRKNKAIPDSPVEEEAPTEDTRVAIVFATDEEILEEILEQVPEEEEQLQIAEDVQVVEEEQPQAVEEEQAIEQVTTVKAAKKKRTAAMKVATYQE